MSPKRPRTLPNISITNILTNKEGSAASASAAVEPVTPTATPHARLQRPKKTLSQYKYIKSSSLVTNGKTSPEEGKSSIIV